MLFVMLTDAVVGLLNFLIAFFPLADAETVTLITSQVTNFRDLMVQANWIFPVADFFLVVSAVFTVESAYWIYKLIRYILSILTLNLIK